MSAIVAYARVSTDDQTCENQRRTISARYAVAKWFTDDGVSVRSLRPSAHPWRPCLPTCGRVTW
jgi:DNA invertase Pin-like site-specific DNA recombinase